MIQLDLLTTLAVAALVLTIGRWLIANVGWLGRSNIPGPVISGLIFATALFLARDFVQMKIDTSLRAPLQSLFFTSIGFNASYTVVRQGGPRLLLLWGAAAVGSLIQALVGIGVAKAIGAPAVLGIICGPLTLAGGPATGLAFSSIFEQRFAVAGAGALIIASATLGISAASLVANPLITRLLVRRDAAAPGVFLRNPAPPEPVWRLPEHLLLLVFAAGAGNYVSQAIGRTGLLVPAYIGGMIIGMIARVLDDRRQWFGMHQPTITTIGGLALTFFLSIALMDLKLVELAGLARPMLVILAVQIAVTTAGAIAGIWWLFGRDYEAAVSASGFIGFMLGITPNAVANMEGLIQRFGPAPKSTLTIPIVGAFLIDFANSLLVTVALNLLGR